MASSSILRMWTIIHGETYATFTLHQNIKEDSKKKIRSDSNKENYLGNTAVIPVYVLPNEDAEMFLEETYLSKSFWKIDGKFNSTSINKI